VKWERECETDDGFYFYFLDEVGMNGVYWQVQTMNSCENGNIRRIKPRSWEWHQVEKK
jgi:hypothetical protein